VFGQKHQNKKLNNRYLKIIGGSSGHYPGTKLIYIYPDYSIPIKALIFKITKSKIQNQTSNNKLDKASNNKLASEPIYESPSEPIYESPSDTYESRFNLTEDLNEPTRRNITKIEMFYKNINSEKLHKIYYADDLIMIDVYYETYYLLPLFEDFNTIEKIRHSFNNYDQNNLDHNYVFINFVKIYLNEEIKSYYNVACYQICINTQICS
jgi:hypothetical protein